MQLNLPRRGTVGFREITTPTAALTDYLQTLRSSTEANSLSARAELYRQRLRKTIAESTVEFVVTEEDIMDMDDPDHWGNIDQHCQPQQPIRVETSVALVDLTNYDETDNLISIEEIGEQAQNQMLELKGALHNEESDIDIVFLFGLDSERLACIANDLSKLPTKQVTSILKAFIGSSQNRMLQSDVAVLFRHLVFAHLKQMSASPIGATLLSISSELAERWPQAFIDNIIVASVDLDQRSDHIDNFIKKALNTMDQQKTLETFTQLLNRITNVGSKLSETGLQHALLSMEAVVTRLSNSVNQELLLPFRQFYSLYEPLLSKNRSFAKTLLELTKRIHKLDACKPGLLEILASLNHPMTKVIRKLVEAK